MFFSVALSHISFISVLLERMLVRRVHIVSLGHYFCTIFGIYYASSAFPKGFKSDLDQN